MNKKGLTIVELIVSFSLTMVICVFLIQIILNLTKLYDNNNDKTTILSKQSTISDYINTMFKTNNYVGIKAGADENSYYFCLDVECSENDELKIDKKDNKIKFENLVIELDEKIATFETPTLDIIYSPVVDSYSNDAILTLTIPIKSDIDYNFDIKTVYQFKTSNSNIDEYFTD